MPRVAFAFRAGAVEEVVCVPEHAHLACHSNLSLYFRLLRFEFRVSGPEKEVARAGRDGEAEMR